MLIRRLFIFKLFFPCFLLISIVGYSQQRITVNATDLPLNVILNKVANEYHLRFAFDDDLLSKIGTSFHTANVSLSVFLDELCIRYGLKYKLIAGTYVFYIDNEIKIIDAIQATAKKPVTSGKEVPLPEPVPREFKLSGIVKDKKTGDKIQYCKIQINDRKIVVTNEMGYFSQTVETNDKLHLIVKHLGYRTTDTIFVVQNSIPLDLELDPIPVYIEPLRMSQIKMLPFLVDLSGLPEMITYNPKSTIQVPSVESNDLVNALTIIPGINYLKGIDTGLSIRGGAPSDNLVLLDGIPIIETSHLMGNLSVLNAKYIQQAFVSRGGFGAEYGGRTSGIVDLTAKSGNSDHTVVDFTANLLHINIYVGMPITPKVSLSASFKKSFVDVWSEFLINSFALEGKSVNIDQSLTDDATVSSTTVNYSDANLKLSIRPDRRKELSFNFFNSFDSQQREYSFPDISGEYYQNNTVNSRTTGYSINQKTQSRRGWLNTLSVGYNKLNNSTVSENGKTPDEVDRLVKTFFDEGSVHLSELRATWKSEFDTKYINYKFGLGYNYNSLRYNYQDHEVKIVGADNFNDSISAQSDIQLINGYCQTEVKPFNWLHFRAGVRSLYNMAIEQISMQPRYGLEIFPSNHLKFYYSAGRYLQHLYLSYRIDSYKNASPIWVIPGQKGETLDAFHHIAGTRLEYKKLLINIEAYQKKNMGKLYYMGNEVSENGSEVVNYTQLNGDEVNRGVDVFMQYNTSIFKHLVSYSLSESKERIEGINNDSFFSSFDHQLHRLRVTEIVNFRGWTASVNWYLASGMHYLLNTSTSTQLNFGRLPDFMQLDVSLVKQFDFRYFYADIGVSVLNVLNHRNELSVLNYVLPEGSNRHIVQTTTIATSFSPLFFINLRYE